MTSRYLVYSAICLIPACVFAAPSLQTEQRIQDQIQFSKQLVAQGEKQEGLQVLESLNQENPNHPKIVEALAFNYLQQPDPILASFYFDQAYKLNPNNTTILLYSAQCHAENNDWHSAARLYEAYLQHNAKDQAIWKNLALAKLQTKDTKGALKAYITAFNLDRSGLTPDDQFQIAQLFVSFNNLTRAQEFYTYALKSHSHKMPALIGLLHIDTTTQQWDAAQAKLAQIDAIDSTALNRSQYAGLRQQIAQANAAKLAAAQAQEPAHIIAFNFQEEAVATHTPSQVITLPEPTHPSTETTPSVIESSVAVVPSSTPTVTVAQLQANATQFLAQNQHEAAVQAYWQAINIDPSVHALWFQLSQAYFQAGKVQEAEMAALEATRHSPDNLEYTLNYLKIAQRSQSPQRFVQELIKAKSAFPKTPEITLALARAYDRFNNNPEAAVRYYQEFLQAAPSHPRAAEATAALTRLQPSPAAQS